MKDDSSSRREFVLVSTFISPIAVTTGKENTSNGEMRADVGHERRRCFIKPLISAA